MELIKNIELIKDFIDRNVYNFNYDLIMHSFMMRVQVIDYYNGRVNRIKVYEVKLELADEIEYNALGEAVGVAKLKVFKINEGKYKGPNGSFKEEDIEDTYDVNIKIWNDELNIKCKNVIINLTADQEV